MRKRGEWWGGVGKGGKQRKDKTMERGLEEEQNAMAVLK